MAAKEVSIKAIEVFFTTGKPKLNPEIVLGTVLISLNPMKFVEPGTSNTGFRFILSPCPFLKAFHPCRKTNHAQGTSYNKVLSDTDPAELCSMVFLLENSASCTIWLSKPRAVTWIAAMVRPWLCLFCKVLLVSQIAETRSKGHSHLQNTFCSSWWAWSQIWTQLARFGPN